MKKNLLLAAALCAAFTASAAVEVCFTVNRDEIVPNLSEKPVLAEGTVLAESENVKMIWANETQINAQNCDFNGIKSILVNGEQVDLVPGVGGETNPSGVDIFSGPSQGGVQYCFEVKKDGWLIIPSKISSNKNFYAYEGSFAGEMTLMAYTLGMALYSSDYADLTNGVFTLPADELGYCDLNSPELDKYTLGGTAIAWPIRIFTQNAEAASAGNGTGVIMFPVFADAATYYVFATGSKMNTCGAIFVEGEAQPEVSLYGPATEGDNPRAEQNFVITGKAQTPPTGGIDNIASDVKAAELDWNAPVYNVMGQKVSKNFKGIAIQNGAKFVVK
ncbi:hypothetical protein E4T81_09405 [Barnesiella sp. WM24]|uniref:hypothetical protein n=1 Tax=Barnesiella sp. WM24 TaxID=2558278 RepID=UPI0010721054|nr:hypothetical protein [Barnesiella sp. WM24]TFU93163.1 hypothetical protein E4T81_09405 [Barnesiella sp. WM24]